MNEPNRMKVINLSLATNYQTKEDNGKKQAITGWHRLTAWGKTAELIAAHVKKGTSLYVEGYLKNSTRQDEKGNKYYNSTIVVEDFKVL